jgi:hypothetical protein
LGTHHSKLQAFVNKNSEFNLVAFFSVNPRNLIIETKLVSRLVIENNANKYLKKKYFKVKFEIKEFLFNFEKFSMKIKEYIQKLSKEIWFTILT